jgi:DNA mismatch repair protein MutS2
LELDLRGLRVADGLDTVDAYLDDAALVGMPFVHIIHGHGTGAMREAVRDQLRNHPLVARSRPGERGEGGNGVTVVYLRD